MNVLELSVCLEEIMQKFPDHDSSKIPVIFKTKRGKICEIKEINLNTHWDISSKKGQTKISQNIGKLTMIEK